MLIGHYAPAFALKAAWPRVPLWVFFVSVQIVDVAWAVLVLAGVEKMRVVPGFTETNSLALDFVPFTHSLVATLLWGLGGGLVAACALRRRASFGSTVLIVAGAVMSHWVLDWVVHVPDLPVLSSSGAKVGLGLWNHKVAAFVVELSITLVSVAVYARRTPLSGRLAGVVAVVLTILVCAGFWGPQPGDVTSLVMSALGLYASLAVGAWALERKAVIKA